MSKRLTVTLKLLVRDILFLVQSFGNQHERFELLVWVTILRTKERRSLCKCQKYPILILISKVIRNVNVWIRLMLVMLAKQATWMDSYWKSHSISQIESVDQLKKNISALETRITALNEEKRHVDRSLEEFKNSISCIVCKSLANFPWMV